MRTLLISLFICLLSLANGSGFGQANSQKLQPIQVDSTFLSKFQAAPKFAHQNQMPAATNSAAMNQDPRVVSVPTFSRSFTFGGQTFPYAMIGRQPSLKQATVIPTTYIPMSLSFDQFVDANGNNILIDATVVTDEIKNSPLFENSSYSTGFTQFVDADMRAEFFNLFNKDGDNDGDDGFHVLFGRPKTLIPVIIEVPIGSGVVFQTPDGSLFALLDVNFVNSQLTTLIQTEGVSVDSVPIFITRNAVYGVFINGSPATCCIGGFHTAVQVKQTAAQSFVQVFLISTVLDADIAAQVFQGPQFADINALSHELGETANDPFVTNITPNYQLPGLPSGFCQNNLEVGDGVENLVPDFVTITLHGFDYHPQTLALLQWFEGITPSDAISGAYSFPDTTKLTSPFSPCPF